MKTPMKGFLIASIFCSISFISNAQLNNLIFLSQGGERFTIVLNGIPQNATPESKLKITGLPGNSYKLAVQFENAKIPELDRTLMFQKGTQSTYSIRKNKSGTYTVRLINQVPIDQVSQPKPDQVVVTFIPEAREINRLNTFDPHKNPYKMPGYHGSIGCPYPMTEQDFKDFKGTIKSKNFEDSKLQIAKEGINTSCLSVLEIIEIMGIFGFEASRLEFAKFAYQHTYDLDNYYKVNKAFQFESSISELKDYIDKNPQH